MNRRDFIRESAVSALVIGAPSQSLEGDVLTRDRRETFPATGPIPAKDPVIHTPARPVAIASVTATQPLTQLLRIELSKKGSASAESQIR
jgi:hypothetical protein